MLININVNLGMHIFLISLTVVYLYISMLGKTFVMGSTTENDNSNNNHDSQGIIPLSVVDIFNKKKMLEKQGKLVELEMTYLEIYNEQCYDLLNSLMFQSKNEDKENQKKKVNESSKEVNKITNNIIFYNNNNTKDVWHSVSLKNNDRSDHLEMRDNSKGETTIEGLSSWTVADYGDVNKLLIIAAKAR